MSEQIQTEETVTIELDQKKTFEEYLKDPELNNKLDFIAIHLAEVANNNWTTATYLLKKSKIKEQKELAGFLDLLVLTKRAFVKKQNNSIKYKITINPEIRKKVLVAQIEEMKNSIKLLELELISIS